MEKTLTIDGREVKFKSTAATPKRFKAQFGKDFFGELMKLTPLMSAFEKMNNVATVEGEQPNLDMEVIKLLDFDLFYDIIWTLAKTADKTIPEPIDWLDEFDEFPIMEILPELNELIASSFQGKKKPSQVAKVIR